MKTIDIDSQQELDDVAGEIIGSLDGRRTVAFYGPMGAGKTTLISRMAAQLGADDTVTSPTFAIVNHYEGRCGAIYHFDMYRIERPEEALDFGCEEYFASEGLCLVEWPEKIAGLLPGDAMKVTIEVTGPESRRFILE